MIKTRGKQILDLNYVSVKGPLLFDFRNPKSFNVLIFFFFPMPAKFWDKSRSCDLDENTSAYNLFCVKSIDFHRSGGH